MRAFSTARWPSSPLRFLASDGAVHVNGQAFVVYGGLIQLLQGWQPMSTIEADGGWSLSEVHSRISERFQGCSAKLPPLG